MNTKRILIGGIAGAVAILVVQMVIHSLILMPRYEILQQAGHLQKDPRVPFMPLNIVVDLLVGVGLAWVYAAARGTLGPGPKTALTVGLAVGLIAGVPAFLADFAWSMYGGRVSLWWTVDTVAGFTLATLVGGLLYRD